MARSERITFAGSQDAVLAARLDWPDTEPKAFALFAHCFSCSKDVFAASRIAQGLVRHGIAVLRFDFTGLGNSEGDFANTNFSSNVEDLLQAVDFLRKTHQAPSLLIGHSLGGSATLVAAPQVPEAKAVVTLGAPSEAQHVIHNFMDKVPEIEAAGEAEVVLGGRPFTIRKQFLDDLEGDRVLQAAAGLRKALLVMHAPLDATVSIDNATGLFVAAKHPKSFVSLDRADHLITDRADAAYAADVIEAWASRYLETGPTDANTAAQRAALASAPAPKRPVETGEKEVLVSEMAPGPYSAQMVSGRYVQTGDQPADSGGTDLGPGPYDYLAWSLGLCTVQTIRVYAGFKKLTLGPVAARVTYDKRHKEDCEDCAEGKASKVLHFSVELILQGVDDPSVQEKLVEIAHKCPVHQTLAHQHVPIEVKVA